VSLHPHPHDFRHRLPRKLVVFVLLQQCLDSVQLESMTSVEIREKFSSLDADRGL
jgi:hypothetical protein